MTITGNLEDLSVEDLCNDLVVDLDLFDLRVEIPPSLFLELDGPTIPDPGDVAGRLIAKINVALLPLVPLFDVIDLLLSLKALFEAILSLNPFKISLALPKIYVKINKLLRLVPVIALPRSIKSIIKVLIVYLKGQRAQIELIIKEQSAIDLRAQRAIAFGSADLKLAVGCSQNRLDYALAMVVNNAAPFNRLIGTVNLFCEIAGLPTIPAVTITPGAAAKDLLVPFDEAIAALTTVYNAIPVP